MLKPRAMPALAITAAALFAGAGCRGGEANESAPAQRSLGERVAGRAASLPDDPTLLRAFAKVSMEEGRFPEAAAALSRLVALAPEDRDALRWLAEALLELDDEEGALAALRRLLARHPEDEEALFTLGGLLASRHADEQESLAEAIALWERYLAAAGEHPHASMVRRALPRMKQRLEKMEESKKADAGVNSP